MACIEPKDMEALKQEFLAKGGVNGFRKMTSEQRIQFFEEFITRNMGKLSDSSKAKFRKDAEEFAYRVEQQILVPSQNAALNEWAALGATKKAPKDILSTVIDNQQILTPGANNEFLELAARKKLGFGITKEDAKDLMDLANTANTMMAKFKSKFGNDWENYDDTKYFDPDRVALGEALLKFKDKYSDLYLKGKTRNQTKLGKFAYEFAGAYKSLRASVDISFGRNLSGAILTGQKGVGNAWWSGVKTFWKGIGNPEYARGMDVLLLTRKNALNGNYQKFGLDIGMAEDVFPPSYWDKLKGGVNLITRSDESFRIASQYARANMFDAMWDMGLKDMNNDAGALTRLWQEGDVGAFINSITGRGKTGFEGTKYERALNVAMFSPKWLAARVERLFDLRYAGKIFGNRNDVKTMRGRAAVKYAAVSIALGVLMRALFDRDENKWEDYIEWRGSSFLQGKIGGVVIDPTFGVASLVTTFARTLTGETVTQEGVVKSQQRPQTIARFLSSKESPIMSLTITAAQAGAYGVGWSKTAPKNFMGEEYTWQSFMAEEIPPITGSNMIAAAQSDDSNDWLTTIADIAGISARTNTQDRTKPGLTESVIKEQNRVARAINKASLSSKLSKQSKLYTSFTGAKRDRVQREYQDTLNRELDRLFKSSAYRRLDMKSKDDQQRKVRDKVQRELKKKYGIK